MNFNNILENRKHGAPAIELKLEVIEGQCDQDQGGLHSRATPLQQWDTAAGKDQEGPVGEPGLRPGQQPHPDLAKLKRGCEQL